MTEKRFSYEEVNFCNDNLTGNQFDLTNPNEMLYLLNSLADESKQIKHIIKEAYNNERTQIGKSVLKQLMEQIQ